MRTKELEALFQRAGYRFRDGSLAAQALTHKSYSNENPRQAPEHNERMEFLGDAVLDFVISDLLMSGYPELSEGHLSKMRAGLVSEPALASVARDLGLGAHLRMGRGEAHSGGQDKDSILSDALEALFAAIYLDSAPTDGVATIRQVVGRLFGERLRKAGGQRQLADFKTELQERVQKHYKETVRYSITRERGPDHEKQFDAAVSLQNRELGRGSGRTKKQAEQEAARRALSALEAAGEGVK